ncbi:hypothetical protein EMCRGX_G008950 [Ephydatia muelleri]
METSDPVLEGLIRDIMIVASECEFDNDIHRLVNSLSYQDPTSCSLDDLMGISDRYGDIVYNLISLREMYNQPIHELINGPAFPLLLDEDRDPDEIKAALAMVSHTQQVKDTNPATPTVQGNDISTFAPSALHREPTAAPSQEGGVSHSSPSQLCPTISTGSSQLASSPVPTGETLLLSSLKAGPLFGPFGVTSKREKGVGRSHSWVWPVDTKAHHHHNRKRAADTSTSSSSSSNEVYHPHSLSKKKSRRLSEPSRHSQMEPTEEWNVDDRVGRCFHSHVDAPSDGALMIRPPCNDEPHPQALLEGTPLEDLPGISSVSGQPENDVHCGDADVWRPPWGGRAGGYREEEEEEAEGGGGGPARNLGNPELHSPALGLMLNRDRRQAHVLANAFAGLEDPSVSKPLLHPQGGKPLLPHLGGRGTTDPVKDIVLDSDSVGAESMTTADKEVLMTLNTHTTLEQSKGLSAPPHPIQQQPGSVPQSPTPMGSVDGVHQLENKCVKHAQPKRRPKRKDDENEYQGLKLWQFLLHLLLEDKHPSILCWVSKGDGLFRVLDSEGLASMWGGRRGHTDMNYDKMSRALRYYYNKNLLDKAPRRLHYQFKYYSRWWERLQAVDPTFKMAAGPRPPETKLAEDDIIAMGIVDCEGAGQLQDSQSPRGSRDS